MNSSNIKIFKYHAYLVFQVQFPLLNRQYRGIGSHKIKTIIVITLLNGNRQTVE